MTNQVILHRLNPYNVEIFFVYFCEFEIIIKLAVSASFEYLCYGSTAIRPYTQCWDRL